MKTALEILKMELYKEEPNWESVHEWLEEERDVFNICIKAMEAYAAQFTKSSELPPQPVKGAEEAFEEFVKEKGIILSEEEKESSFEFFLGGFRSLPVKDAQWVDAKKEMPAEGKQVLLQIWYMDGNNHKEAFEFTIGFQIADKWHFKTLYGTPVKWQYISPPTKK